MTAATWTISLVVVLLVVGVVVVVSHGRFVRQRALVDEAWRQICAERERRHELVEPLTTSVERFAAHERTVFDDVAVARTAAAQDGLGPATASVREEAFTASLSQLLTMAAAYPQLRVDPDFASLTSSLDDIEDRIGAGRRLYNGHARTLNARMERLPGSAVARLFGMVPAEYFEVQDPTVRSTDAPAD